MLVMKALRQIISVGRVSAVPGRRGFSLPSPLRTTGSQGSWDCTIVRPTEDLLLFPQMFSVGRVIAMVFDGTSSAQSQSQESPLSVAINGVCFEQRETVYPIVRIINKLKHYEFDPDDSK